MPEERASQVGQGRLGRFLAGWSVRVREVTAREVGDDLVVPDLIRRFKARRQQAVVAGQQDQGQREGGPDQPVAALGRATIYGDRLSL
jgi:hypothetical protein